MNEQVVQRFRALFDIYLLYIAFAMLVIGWHDTHTQIGWTLGDWLINYHGGFVRRGLVGELVLHIGKAVHLSPLYVAAGLGMLLYVALWLSVRELLPRSSWSPWIPFAVLSPATLAFGILDDRAGFHKEIIFLAGLGLLLLFLRKATVSDVFLSTYLTVASAVCILSHEPLFVYMPYYVAAVVIGRESWRRVFGIMAVPFVIGVCCFYASAAHPGNRRVASRICTSLTTLGPTVCDGAVDYISHDRKFARKELLTEMHRFHYASRYPAFAALSLLPIAWGFYSLSKREQLRKDLWNVGALSFLSIVGSSVLFLYATDWGRWIYIHVFSLFLLLLFLSSRAASPPSDYGRTMTWLQSWDRGKAVGLLLLLLLYSSTWNMPGYGDHPAHGYANIVIHLLHHPRPNPPDATT